MRSISHRIAFYQTAIYIRRSVSKMVNAASLFAGLVGLASLVSAHPGHDVKAEAAERAAFLKHAPVHARGLSQCETQLKARGHEKANVARRQEKVEHLRRKRGLASHAPLIKARDVDTVLNTTHHSSLEGVTPNIDPHEIFAYNPTCVLGPDVTQGPYCTYCFDEYDMDES